MRAVVWIVALGNQRNRSGDRLRVFLLGQIADLTHFREHRIAARFRSRRRDARRAG